MLSLRSRAQTMNVLNAAVLMTTASSMAIAFSLIMRMVRFPVLLWFGLARHGEGERGEGSPPGHAHHMDWRAQLSIAALHKNISTPQAKIAIGASCAGPAKGMERPLETRPPMIGGRMVAASRVLLARPVVAGHPAGWRPRGETAVRTGSCRVTDPPCSAWCCHAMAPHGGCRVEREGPGAHRVGAIWCSMPSNANAKTPRLVAQIAIHSGVAKRKRPPDFSGGRVLFQKLGPAQLAATSRPRRASSAATRSTSASAATRASAMHFSSTGLRP